MKDNPFAGLVAAVLVVPLVVLCCLGPALLGSLLGGMAGWLGGLNVVEMAGAAVAAGLVAYGLLRWRRARVYRAGAQQACGHAGSPSAPDKRAGTAVPSPSARFPSLGTVDFDSASQNRVHGDKFRH